LTIGSILSLAYSHNITRRYNFIILPIVSLILSGLALIIALDNYKATTLDLQDKSQTLLRIGVINLKEAVWMLSDAVITNYAEAVMMDPDVVAVQVENHLGDPLNVQKRNHYKTFSIKEMQQHKGLIYCQGTIMNEGEKVGFLHIVISTSRVEKAFKKAVTFIILFTVTSILLMGVIIWLATNRFIRRPILDLDQATSVLAQGKLDIEIKLDRRDELGNLARRFAFMRDAIREKMDALKKAEKKYRDIFENAYEGIFQSTPEGRLINANRSMAKIFGYDSPDQMISLITDIATQCYAAPNENSIIFEDFLEKDQLINIERKFKRKDGSFFWGLESVRAVKDHHQELHYYEGTIVDITERKKREKAEKERVAEEIAIKAKSEFFANMSHELRTPLNSILGFSQLMRHRENVSPEYAEHLDTIIKSGEHLLTLINDVLTMSKIEAGRFTLNKTGFDLYRFLDDLEHILSLKAKEKGLELIFKRCSGIPRFIITDQIKLRQVLINLISNAIKFTQTGKVTFQTEIQHVGREVHLQFIVQDTGQGIAPKDLANIFDPFVQAEKTQHSQEGTGLGLSISRDFADIMDGSLTGVSSGVPGEGSVFTLDIKVETSEQSEEMAKSIEAEHAGPGYLHEGQSPEKPLKVKFGQTVRDLSALSPEWLNAFNEAIESIDMTAAVDLIKQIDENNQPLAEALMTHLENYRFDVLQSLMKGLEL